MGVFPIVKAFAPGKVHYAGVVVTHEGALWQASVDTGHAPPSDDWAALAAKGSDGVDGTTPVVRSTWKAGIEYHRLDIAVTDGSAFIARKDNPGACPGDDWQLIAAHGRQGIKGPPGIKGDRGDIGPSIVGWKVDRDKYTITPILSDGVQQAAVSLRELFEQFDEAR
jgi:hypothetical protein